MANPTELQQEIVKILLESPEPQGPSSIALELEQEKNKIHYHLKKLINEGTVLCSEEGKYSVNEKEMKIIQELADNIFSLLLLKEYSPKELEHALDQDEEQIFRAISKLESDGLIKEGETSLRKRTGLPRKGRTTNVIDYFRTSTYTPTYLGYSKMGRCPICKEKLSIYETVSVAFFKRPDGIRPEPWYSIKIHSKCLHESKAYESTYGKYEPSMFCSYCGLPLTPKMLPVRQFNYELLMDHFYVFELNSIDLLKGLRQSWIVSPKSPALKDEIIIRPDNSTIEQVYDKLKIEMPEWLAERIKKDESNPEESYEDICHKISRELISVFNEDLSMLENAERFQRLLLEYRCAHPEGYDVNSRIKEIWTAAREMKSKYEQNIQKYYAELLGPAASIQSCIDWATNPKDYDFDKLGMNLSSIANNLPTFAQSFAIKCGDEYYHPHCADKLGLDYSHCNDQNRKLEGGEAIE